jgi:hypothetical protein
MTKPCLTAVLLAAIVSGCAALGGISPRTERTIAASVPASAVARFGEITTGDLGIQHVVRPSSAPLAKRAWRD